MRESLQKREEGATNKEILDFPGVTERKDRDPARCRPDDQEQAIGSQESKHAQAIYTMAT